MRPPLRLAATGKEASSASAPDDAELLKLEAIYCSHGDTVHYSEPKIFDRCEGSYLYDAEGRQYLDLQMWYSAVNFGYANRRLNDALKRQLDRLPQVASQYLHREKIELAAMIARDAEAKFGRKGRVHFNVGGIAGDRGFAQARAQRHWRQEPDVRVRGRLSRPHPRRFGDHVVLSLSPPLRPLRRPRPLPAVSLSLPRPQGHEQGGVRPRTACGSSSGCSRANITASGIRKRARPSTPRSTSRPSRAPAAT